MIIKFLGSGTSQGIPIVGNKHPVCLSSDLKDKRLRSSVMICNDQSQIVIDCGPDFRQQMLREDVQKIDAILFTHEHADHTAGLDDIRGFCSKQGQIPIYGQARVIEQLKIRFDYIFRKTNRYPGSPEITPIEIDNSSLKIKDLEIVPIKVQHGNLDIMGYRINDFAYITDAKYVEESEMEKLKDLDVLVVNALRIEPHPTHFNLEEAISFSKKIRPKSVYFTHISHMLGFHKEVSKSLPKDIFLSYDGLELSL